MATEKKKAECLIGELNKYFKRKLNTNKHEKGKQRNRAGIHVRNA